ncbi:DUF4175 family protein [Mucilaginibacter sp. AW1-3]
MAEQNGIQVLQRWQRQWVSYQLIADVLIAAACDMVAASVLHYLFLLTWAWAAPVFVVVLGLLLLLHRPWQITAADVSRYLNRIYPELEESCELVIAPQTSLNVLQNLQLGKVERILYHLPQPPQFTRRVKMAGLVFLVGLVLSFAFAKIKWPAHLAAGSSGASATAEKHLLPEKLLPAIEAFTVKIEPPAYTSKPPREQSRFGLEAEEGATVVWLINTNTEVKTVELLFNEKQKLVLHPVNGDKTKWSAGKQIDASGFYQVNIEGILSDYYNIEIIKDAPPVITIKTPKQYTYIDAGESPKVPLSVAVSDDYGVADAFIYATIAKGSGEAVKFKEQKMLFNTSFAGHNRQYPLGTLLNLPKLGMEPGDELYFYIQAQDNHSQQTRTDVYIVSIQDTAQLLSMNGMTMGVSLIPEYFRSERQIIMDSEKLLKDKDSISVQAFKDRSNNIGIDQKLLRLRYGKFLGEEEESSEGAGAGKSPLDNPEDFSNAQKILDTYTDKHDNAEDASFLEKSVKEQLKATLNEMWRAELQLRTFNPQAAIPFEYKALRLLKDLQQKSRAYVPKTAYKPPPLKLIEKRLSGDLSKIGQPLIHEDVKADADAFETLKKAAAILEQVKQSRKVQATDVHTLQQAGQQISAKATVQPGSYLPAVSAMHHILSAQVNVNQADIAIVQQAIQKILPIAVKLPQPAQTGADMGLGQDYFKNLNRNNK